MIADIKRLSANSLVYTVGTVLSRGIVVLLVPVYTRVLTPDDFGILAVTATVGVLVTTIIGLSLESAITQLYFQYGNDVERRSLYATLLAFWLVVPGLATLLLDAVGRTGRLDWSPTIRFQPYLRLTLWTSYLSIFINLPSTIYATRQEALRVVVLLLSQSLLTTMISLYLVVVMRGGALASLQATLYGTAIGAAVSVVLTARMASWNLSWAKLRSAMSFSLPLVPHTASQWALSLSDRVILSKYVSTGQLGLYSLGYQVSALISFFTQAVTNALAPIVNVQLNDNANRHKVPILGTYALFGTVFVGLAVALLGSDLIRLVTPPKFHGSARVIPLLALGFVFQGIYLIWSRGTWVSRRTGWMPILTAIAGIINIGLNLWLIPRWGIMAAAFSTAVAYGALALLQGSLAEKLHHIPWEYSRWFKLLAGGLACFAVGTLLSSDRPAQNVVLKGLVCLVLYPVSLGLMSFLTNPERRVLLSVPVHLRLWFTRFVS